MTIRPRRTVLAIAFNVVFIASATAHAHLATAAPAPGSTVAAAPTELRLGFSEGLSLKFTGVTMTGASGRIPTGIPALAPGDDKVLVVPIAGQLTPGSYKVDWHALAADGHKTTGSYGFTIIP